MNFLVEGNHSVAAQRALDIALNRGNITIAVPQLTNLDGILKNILGDQIINKLKKNKKITIDYNGNMREINVLTKIIKNPINASLLALYTNEAFTKELLNKNIKDFFYVPWTEDEINWGRNNLTTI